MQATLRTLTKNGWRRTDAIRATLAVVAAFVATFPAWNHMVSSALNHEYARHAILVPIVFVWLLWVRRSRLRMIVPDETWPGWVMLAAGAQTFYVSYYIYGLHTSMCIGGLLMVLGALIVTTGKSVLVNFLPAWIALFMLIPFPATAAKLLTSPIQYAEAEAITAIYRTVGIEAWVIDDPRYPMVTIGSAVLPLTSIFKGLASALAVFVICYGFVFGMPMRPIIRVSVLVLSPFITLACGAVSLLCTLWVYGSRELIMADTVRAVSEWATVLLAFLLITALLKLLSWISVPVYELHLASDY